MLAAERATPLGALWAVAGVVCFSLNDVIVKFLSGDYPLYQLIFLRSLVGATFILGVLLPLQGPNSILKTRRPVMHLLRGCAVVMANFTFFLGLAVLPLGEAVAIFFVSPLIIAVFSVVFLRERVGTLRWAAIAIGLIGVVIVMRPGTEAFRPAALLPVLAATFYATLHILTRRIGGTESAVQMAFYIQLTFIVISGTAGLALGDGRFDVFEHPSAQFIFRAWTWPAPFDATLIVALGLTSALGGFSISQAYRLSEASLVAPFEYIALPLAVFWGMTLFGERPDAMTFSGIALILGGGLALIWRERVRLRRAGRAVPRG